MTPGAKLKEELSKTVSSLLMIALELCRQGEVEFCESLGLSMLTMQKLDNLKPDQIPSISGNYVRELGPNDLFQIDSTRITKIIDIASEETKIFGLVDEYLRKGACKKMMGELFGLRSTQVANRKKFLNIPTVKGRLTVVTQTEERMIYDSWLLNIKTIDYRERLLLVARDTTLSLSKIYRVVQEIEIIQNEADQRRICA